MSATAYQRRRREIAKAKELEEKVKAHTKRAPKKVKDDVEPDK